MCAPGPGREGRLQRGTGDLAAGDLAALRDRLFGPPERPGWFDPSITRILRQGDAVIAAAGPGELEQVIAELTAGEVYWALREVRKGLWFAWWFRELARAAGERVKSEAAREGGAWQAPWRRARRSWIRWSRRQTPEDQVHRRGA